MSLPQVKFLGASVTGFTANIGWGSQESRLQCSVVEDYRSDDEFIPPIVGHPVIFDYDGWVFCGLLEGWQKSNNFSINPGYDVTVVDPRVLLDGVHLILSEYNGVTNGVPNLINVFGYLESVNGFGGSKSNDSGIEWWKISNTITDLTAMGQSTLYGGPISYKGIRYNINLSGLPQIPNYYRVSGNPNISLMDFINEICEAGACEYFVTLLGTTITVNTISRANVPLAGMINLFVSNTSGAVSKNVGLDMVNDVSSKFLIGGKKSDIYFSTYGTGEDNTFDESEDNPIWYYWGKDADGNLIVSNGINDAFVLDARGILIPNVPNAYKTDINEMRAALVGQDSWETFLWLHCYNEYLFDSEGEFESNFYHINNQNAFVEHPTRIYYHNNVRNPHFRKAFDIGLGCKFNYNLALYLNGATPQNIVAANTALFRQFNLPNYNKEQEDNMSKLYGFVHSYADEYYGRKFMVILPDVSVKQDSETGELSFSHNIVEAGYLSDSTVLAAINNNILPVYINDVSLEDGRITGYVRFDNIEELDLSGLQPQDISFGKDLIKKAGGKAYTGKNSVFIRCGVEDKFVFLDKDNFTSPRAIITLTSRIPFKEEEYGNSVLAEYLNQQATMNGWSQAQKDAVHTKFLGSLLEDIFSNEIYPYAVLPDLAAIPIESNVDTYGPWYAAGANGRIEVEHATDLVPWNYNGFTNMNLAANARVTETIANLQWIESGSIEFPDKPEANLGSQLLSTGPYITDISVEISDAGYKTTYRMRSWNPKFGKISKYNVDRIQKMAKLAQQIKRNFREKIKLNTFKNKYLQVDNKGIALP